MGRKSKFNSLEIELASSILYYDKEEMLRFFDIFDSISSDSNIVMDGTFNLFVSYIKKFKNFEDDYQKRRQNLIDEINLRNNQNPNKTIRDNFEIWFSKVLETETHLELADDILNHLIWEEYKKAIDLIDKSDISFSEKISIRPKIPKSFNQDGLIYLDDIEIEEEKDMTSYTTGLEKLDKIVEFARTNFVVIAARPGVGKSLLMLLMAIANAREGVKTLFLSFEMNSKSLDGRILNHYAGDNIKDQHKDENGVLNFNSYKQACLDLKSQKGYKPIKDNLQLYVSKASSADSIITKIEDQIKEGKYEAIFIDYLQLLKFNGMDEWASLRVLTKELKNLAFRTNTLIVTGSQVSRSSTERGIYLSDLFGSASIEADADIVIGLENTRERRQGEKALINVKVMKSREGDLAELKYIVDYSTGKLYENE